MDDLFGLPSDQLWDQACDQLPVRRWSRILDQLSSPRWNPLWGPLSDQLEEDWTDGN